MMKTLHQLENHMYSLVRMSRKLGHRMAKVNQLSDETKKDVPIVWMFTLLKNTRKRFLEDIARKQEEIRLKTQMEALMGAAMEAEVEAATQVAVGVVMEAVFCKLWFCVNNLLKINDARRTL